MQQPVVEIYGTRSCPWCDRAKELVERHGYRSVYYDMTGNKTLQDEFITRTNGAKTVPQIFVGIRRIGGFTDLEAAHNSGVLQQLLGGQ